MLVVFVSGEYRDLINVFILDNLNFSAFIMWIHFLKLKISAYGQNQYILSLIFHFTVIILVALKIRIIRWGAYYDTDTNFLLFGCEIYAYSQTFKKIISSAEGSIQMISKIKTICLPIEKQFTYQLRSTASKGMEISSIKGKGWRGGCFIIKFPPCAWAFIFSQLILTRKLPFPPHFKDN